MYTLLSFDNYTTCIKRTEMTRVMAQSSVGNHSRNIQNILRNGANSTPLRGTDITRKSI